MTNENQSGEALHQRVVRSIEETWTRYGIETHDTQLIDLAALGAISALYAQPSEQPEPVAWPKEDLGDGVWADVDPSSLYAQPSEQTAGGGEPFSDEPMGDGEYIYRTTLMGERHIVHAATGFVWFKLPYDYRYTDNATQRATAERILAALGGSQ